MCLLGKVHGSLAKCCTCLLQTTPKPNTRALPAASLIQLLAPRPLLIQNSNPKMCNMESVRMLIDCLMCTTNAWMNPFKKCSVYLDIGLCHLAYLAPRLPSFLPLYLVFHKQDLRTRFYFLHTIFLTKQVLHLLKFQLRCERWYVNLFKEYASQRYISTSRQVLIIFNS